MKAYIITYFDLKTDVMMKYSLKHRWIHYSEKDLLYDIQYILENILKEYQDITNTNISYNDFYNKFKLTICVDVLDYDFELIDTEEKYNKYLNTVKSLNKEELYEYLSNHVDRFTLIYDHNLNIKETYTQSNDNSDNFNNYYRQFSFSYKALFPEKYHVNKFKEGDKVLFLYNNKEYTINKVYNANYSIYDSEDPLNFIKGYSLYNVLDDEYLPDDRFGYYPIDEDLIKL